MEQTELAVDGGDLSQEATSGIEDFGLLCSRPSIPEPLM
jgi:hypothetical protein